MSDLLTTECAHCRPRREDVWIARYPGTCPTCSGDISMGDMVQWDQSGTRPECARH